MIRFSLKMVFELRFGFDISVTMPQKTSIACKGRKERKKRKEETVLLG